LLGNQTLVLQTSFTDIEVLRLLVVLFILCTHEVVKYDI